MKQERRWIKALLTILGFGIGVAAFPSIWKLFGIGDLPIFDYGIVDGILGAVVFYIIAMLVAGSIIKQLHAIQRYLAKQTPSFILFGAIFTLLGLLLANVISIPLYRINLLLFNTILPIFLMIGLGYLGFWIGTNREEWRGFFQNRKRTDQNANISEVSGYHKYKVLDTSVIIDGRIYDIAKTGFIEGVMLVPNFVLHEIQLISDSPDNVKRARGRRGLDILNDMQNDPKIAIKTYDADYNDTDEVDRKLVELAKDIDGVVVTNDFNLNKATQFQNVPVLNINELAMALKPRLIAGESMTVTVIKSGTERQQGVAYLDDGTMVVVEDGQNYLNQPLDVVVTSAIQTDAGRMIFAKPAHSQRRLKGK